MKKYFFIAIALFLICFIGCGGSDSNSNKNGYKVTYSVISNSCLFESIHYIENGSYCFFDPNDNDSYFYIDNENTWSHTFQAQKGDMLGLYITRSFGCDNFGFIATILVNDKIIKEKSMPYKEGDSIILEAVL